MMTFKQADKESFVWIWLPNETTPIVCGKLDANSDSIVFNYGKSYLNNRAAIPIYEPELPLQPGILPLTKNLIIANCIRDAAPDAWGRRVIINKLMGSKGTKIDTNVLNELTYLLQSGSDRIGALDFQHSAQQYRPRLSDHNSPEELLTSAERVEKGISLNSGLDQALLHGSSIGGARPKALITSKNTKYIAKFSSNNDVYNVIKIEFVAMRLAMLVGLTVAPVRLTKALNKDILLIERFDREYTSLGWKRKHMVSALTLFNLDEMMARYASYENFAEIIRCRFSNPKQTLIELFSRLVFNILCGNTDDHARNHAAFYNGKELTLTPAYDICPQGRSGNTASQAMLISGNNNLSQLKNCLDTAHNFLLSEKEARQIIDHQKMTIKQHWDAVCDAAQLSSIEKQFFWGRQFLNPYSLETE